MHHIFRLFSNSSMMCIDHPLTAWSDRGEVKTSKQRKVKWKVKAPTKWRDKKGKREREHLEKSSFSLQQHGFRLWSQAEKHYALQWCSTHWSGSLLMSLLALRLHGFCLSSHYHLIPVIFTNCICIYLTLNTQHTCAQQGIQIKCWNSKKIKNNKNNRTINQCI